MTEVRIDGQTLTAEALEGVATGRATAVLPEDRRAFLDAGASWYDRHGGADVLRAKWSWLLGGQPPDDPADTARLFVLGHCAGVGTPLSAEEVRALLVARANVLAAGWSGVRGVVVERILAALAAGLHPEVPSQGAVGVAGSIQLAHAMRAIFGWGGRWLPGVDASALASLPEVTPSQKETLSLLNGSTMTTALAALAVARARRLLRQAEGAAALSLEVVRADANALAARPAEVRGHPGITAATRRLRELVTGSELVTEQRSPDSFSVRCAPTVLGAARDALDFVELVVTRELNGVGDNPMVFPGHAIVEGGHFHAAPVALAMDHLKIAMVQVASIAERRVFRMTYGNLSGGLPSFLVPGSGVNSGLMLAQYTAASLLSEARGLSMPASIDNVPTVQHHEDHVSMGPIAARSALEVLDRVADIVGIELLCGAQGLDFRMSGDLGPPQQPGVGTRSIYDRVRQRVRRWDDDQVLHTDLVAMGTAVRAGVFV